MDPNAAAAELSDLREIRQKVATQNNAPRYVLRTIDADIRTVVIGLREWRRKGGFAPRDGWPKGV